jgi:hypothetical protein
MDAMRRNRCLMASRSMVLVFGAILLARAEARTDTVSFVLTFGGGMGAGIERPPPQRLRVPRAWVSDMNPQANSEGVIESGAAVLAMSFDGKKFVPVANPQAGTWISLSITAAGYDERVRQLYPDDDGNYELPDLGPDAPRLPTPTKGPKLPFGLHELVKPAGAPQFQSRYFGDDPELGFVIVKCEAKRELNARYCAVTAPLTTYLTLSFGMEEAELPGWRKRMLAARALTLPLVDKQ